MNETLEEDPEQRAIVETEEASTSWQRALTSVAGGTLFVLGLRRRSMGGYVAALAGGWMLYRGLKGSDGREVELSSLEHRAVDVHRTLTIDADREEIISFLREPSNLSRIVGEVGDVRSLGEGRQRWTLQTPFERALVWEMHLEEDEEGPDLRWTSMQEEGSPNEVTVDVAAGSDGQPSQLTVEVRYDPPGGELGHAVMQRLDIVPLSLIARAMHRTKSILETGKEPTGGQTRREGEAPESSPSGQAP